jgi:hypothetical protein
MTNTERKLDEARYFLEQLNPDDPYYNYILSAYLNAARSTSWVMRFEFNKVNGWEEWFNSCDISNEQKILLKRINDFRIRSTKQSGIKTDYYFLDCIVPDEQYFPIIKEIESKPEGTEFEITVRSADEEIPEEKDNRSYKIRGKVKLDKDDSESSREAIFKLCTEYFDFLRGQVNNCVNKFG